MVCGCVSAKLSDAILRDDELITGIYETTSKTIYFLVYMNT